MGLSVLSLLLNSPTWYTCTPSERTHHVGPTFGYRFSDVSEIERGKGKQLFLIVQAVYHFFSHGKPITLLSWKDKSENYELFSRIFTRNHHPPEP